MMTPWILGVAGLLAASPSSRLLVSGNATCPSRAEVASALGETAGGFLPGGREAAPNSPGDSEVMRVDLSESATAIRVTLRRASGVVVGDRLLPRSPDCAGVATAIAVVLRSWQIDTQPVEATHITPSGTPAPPREIARAGRDMAARQERDPRRAEDGRPAGSRPVRLATTPTIAAIPPVGEAQSRIAATSPAPPPAPLSEALPATTDRAVGATSPPAHASFDLLAGALGSAAPLGVGARGMGAVGALLGLDWTEPVRTSRASRAWPDAWGLELAFLVMTPRSIALTSSTVEWRRDMIALGPRFRWTVSDLSLALELHGEAILGFLGAQTGGRNAAVRQLGLGAGGRVELGRRGGGAAEELGARRSRWRGWVELRAVDWRGRAAVLVLEPQALHFAEIPWWEAVLALGLSWSIWP